MTKLPNALILTPAEPDHWLLGSGLAGSRFGADDINPIGDWTPYKMQDEPQRRGGLETSGCVVFGSLKAWMMVAKLHGFIDFTRDASERYSGAFAGTTSNGTNPHTLAETTRNVGIIPSEIMPWDDSITTVEEYYDRRMAESLLPLGKKLLDRFEFGHEWVFAFKSAHTQKQKVQLLREALRRGPVCVSVFAWRKSGKYYVNTKKDHHNHWVTALRFDGDRLVIHDQYDPFEKTLSADFEFSAAKVYFLKRREEKVRSFWSLIWDSFTRLWNS